jgi:hypothetical protein
MNATGAHTTYGLAGIATYPRQQDLQIRLNRIALAIQAVGTQRSIKTLFGRTFTNFARLPQVTDERSLAHIERYNAFNTQGRGNICWENRLMTYEADPVKMVRFFKRTEFVFNRAVREQDFIEIFNLLGANTDGE